MLLLNWTQLNFAMLYSSHSGTVILFYLLKDVYGDYLSFMCCLGWSKKIYEKNSIFFFIFT